PSLFRQLLGFRFWQPETRSEADEVRAGADQRGRVGKPDLRRAARHHIHELCRDERRGGANHPAADVGRKAFTSSAQIRWEYSRKIISPKAELRDGRHPDKKHSPPQQGEIADGKNQKHTWKHDQARNLEHMKQAATG